MVIYSVILFIPKNMKYASASCFEIIILLVLK